MIELPITTFFAGVLTLAQVGLSVAVSVGRARTRIELLDGGHPGLQRRIRAHGNFIENVPLALVAMALLETAGLGAAWLWAGGAGFVVGRALHAVSLLSGQAIGARYGGMLLTLLVLTGFGVACILVRS